MQILLVAATSFEIAPALEQLRTNPARTHEIDVLVTGVGLVNTTYSLTRQLNMKRPDLLIQAGIAGCFDRNIHLASCFYVSHDRIADLGVAENNQWHSLFDLGFANANAYPNRKGWLINHNKPPSSHRLKKVKGITVNRITTGKKDITMFTEKFGAVLESMEGAAMHYCCLREKIPFLQLRSVSNYIGDRNKKNWRIKESVASLNIELQKLLNLL